MRGRRETASLWMIVVLALVAGLSIVPTPYYLLAPGSAVELAERIRVGGHRPSPRHFYLTDVTLARASVLLLAGRFFPGTRIVRRETIVPPGVSAKSYDRVLVDAMDESQNIAALVAERAAGYRVDSPPRQLIVAAVAATSHAGGIVREGDRLVRVGARELGTLADVSSALRSYAPGALVRLRLDRNGAPLDVTVRTTANGTHSRLGLLLRERDAAAHLPIPVRYTIADIAGSSGGLMFALAIYATLRGAGDGEAVAGTGTIMADGRVGPIEGTQQKIIAAERAGATVFLVPQQNYAEVAGETGIRVVPVRRFADAVRAIGLPEDGAFRYARGNVVKK